MSTREDVTFNSGGETCAAWLYRPEGADGDVPCVVLAHGFSATREDGLAAYADAFQAAGLAALVFDYRYFGDSTGEPRQLVDIRAQREDYVAAIAFVRGLPGVDPARIALWGTSFSGGHVVAVARRDGRVAAVVAQAPFTDGLSIVRVTPKGNLLRATLLGARDQLAAWRGRAPVLMPAVGAPGTFAAMTAPEAEPGFRGVVPPQSKWRNEFTARTMLRLAAERPAAAAKRLAMPLLICACDRDETTPPGPAVKAAQQAPRGELKRYPYGHFDIYHDEQARIDQVEFLSRHLVAVREAVSA